MAAKKNDPRREARIAKNNRNLNSALTLFTAGFIAEFYLLLINQYFVKGSVDQVVAIAGYLEVMAIVGAAAFGAGVVLTVMRRKWTRFAAAGKWLLGLGLFFGVSSLLMRRVYPMGTTVMCILVPVLMLLAVVLGDDIHRIHPAALCMQSGGWTIESSSQRLLKLPGLSGAVQRLKARYNGMNYLVYVWYADPAFSTGSFPLFRQRWSADGNWQTYQLFTPDDDDADQRLTDFIAAVLSTPIAAEKPH